MSRHIIIGDIHGCYLELLDLLEQVGYAGDDILILLGDLVDRGPDSPAVYRFFCDLGEHGRAIALMGNHERKHVRQLFSYSQEITRLQFGDGYAAAVQWMSRLPYFYETPDLVVVHAALLPEVALAEQREDVLCGSVSGEREIQIALGGKQWYEVYQGPITVSGSIRF